MLATGWELCWDWHLEVFLVLHGGLSTWQFGLPLCKVDEFQVNVPRGRKQNPPIFLKSRFESSRIWLVPHSVCLSSHNSSVSKDVEKYLSLVGCRDNRLFCTEGKNWWWLSLETISHSPPSATKLTHSSFPQSFFLHGISLNSRVTSSKSRFLQVS